MKKHISYLLCIFVFMLQLEAKPQIISDAEASTEWIVEAMRSSGYELDYTIESLKEVDRFFEENSEKGEPTPNGLLSQDLGSRLFSVGSYVGTVLIKNGKGKWNGTDEAPQTEITLAVEFENGLKCWPIQRVMKRMKNGTEDSIYAYGLSIIKRTKD